MLRIGYDAKQLFNDFAGQGSYSRTLLANLAEYYPDNAYFLYAPRFTKSDDTSFFLNSALFNVQLPRRGPTLYWRTLGLKRYLRKHKIGLFHGLVNELPLALQGTGIRSIVTIHDLIFLHYPQHYTLFNRKALDLKYRYACRQADHIVAISESTKRDIIHFYGIAPEKISVIYQSCSERFRQERAQKTIEAVRRRHHLPEEYLLTVGAITARKNLMGTVRALQLLPDSLKLPLVVVGKGTAHKAKIQRYLQQNRLEKWVYFIEASFEDLPAIYQDASVFLYPSFFEGFGLPILEALFSETPVLTSNTSSLPEAGGPGAYLVDPAKPEQIAAGIEKILTDDAYRASLVENGSEYAQQFRGEPLAQQMMELYKKVVGGGHTEPEPIT
ncbi:MAG: glycosyltransferase family 4 protein [Phaeodactylibacter sp.]|nr:glycosyltransferase family 4 protein [Phaeodactylibacter sp.]MCB9299167.1 glycosyltransferase family 4 protein [Lewinellaceae bacterium]